MGEEGIKGGAGQAGKGEGGGMPNLQGENLLFRSIPEKLLTNFLSVAVSAEILVDLTVLEVLEAGWRIWI